MKKLLIAVTALTVLSLGAVSFAFGPGWFGGGHMMAGSGYGGMMNGYGMGPGMMGWTGTPATNPYGYDQEYLNDTRELRKKLNEKRFEYFEALRTPQTSRDKIATLEKEITDLQREIYTKAPGNATRGTYGMTGAPCWR